MFFVILLGVEIKVLLCELFLIWGFLFIVWGGLRIELSFSIIWVGGEGVVEDDRRIVSLFLV